jgi:hypothetical protein
MKHHLTTHLQNKPFISLLSGIDKYVKQRRLTSIN